jgi:23S rRNA (guanosine2251-2'-O)-methyltransferase
MAAMRDRRASLPRGVSARHRERSGSEAHGQTEGSDARVVFGVEPVRELIAASPSAVDTLYVKSGSERRFADEMELVRANGGRAVVAEDKIMGRLAGGAQTRHQGLVATVREYSYAPFEEILQKRPDPLLVIDGVTDPRNLGAILRSAECAGARAVVLARDRTVGLTPAAIKASAGAWVHLRIARCGNVVQALEALKSAGYWTAALVPAGETSIYQLDTTRRLALILGSEGAGVREIVKRAADFRVRIPMLGKLDSLNVSVAAAVALFEIVRRRTP